MSYEMFDKDGNPVTYHDLQDKSPWCKSGASTEVVFVEKYGEKLKIKINPEKDSNPYVPDLLEIDTNNLADLKTQNTPFFKAKTKFGMEPQYTVVFNKKDKERYESKYPNIDIFFWVEWIPVKFKMGYSEIEVKPMSGVWCIPFKKLLLLLDKAPLHEYIQRVGDTRGNAKSSYVLDIRSPEFKRLI